MKQNQAVANALIFNPKSATSASLPSIIKLILSSSVTTNSLTFLLIGEISDSDNDSVDMKDFQEQEKEALNLEAHTIVAGAGPPAI